MSAAIIRHHWNAVLLRELFLLAIVIRLVYVCLFQKPDEAEGGSLIKEPGSPGPRKHQDGHRAVGRSEFPPQSPHRVRQAVAPGRGWPSPRAQGPPFPVVLTL